jgi:hypothetical protein
MILSYGDQRRFLFLANGLFTGAPGMKTAARGNIQRAGDFSGDHLSFLFQPGMIGQGSRD